jgi:hypothetical protein
MNLSQVFTPQNSYSTRSLYCGSSQNTGSCLTSVYFQNNRLFSPENVMYFNCGANASTVKGTGTDSPANDITFCSVYAASRAYLPEPVLSKGTSYKLEGWAGPAGFTWVDVHGYSNPGLMEAIGPSTPDSYLDWVVGCTVVQMDRGDGNSQVCAYQHGALGSSPESTPVQWGSPHCDTYPKADNHSTSALYIGASNTLAYGFSGYIVGVWVFKAALSASEITAFSNPWRGTKPIVGPAFTYMGSQWWSFSTGL